MIARFAARYRTPLLLAPLMVAIALLFDAPLGLMLSRSVTDPEVGLDNYQRLLESDVYRGVLTNTFRIAMVTALIATVLGYPLAHWMSRLPRAGQLAAITLVLLPFWTSVLVRTYAWTVILGYQGLVNETLMALGLVGSPLQLIYNDTGVIVGTVHVLLPFMVLPLYASMLRFDRRLIGASQSLGAGPLFTFWRVYLPLTLPSLAAGFILVFILTLGFFVTPAILGGGKVAMIATVLDSMINGYPRWGLAAALSFVLLAATFAFYAAYRKIGGLEA